MSSETFSMALRDSLYQALTSRARMPGVSVSTGGTSSGGAGATIVPSEELGPCGVVSACPIGASTLLVGATGPPGDGPACEQAERADQGDEHKRAAPGFGLPVRIG